MSIGNCLDAYSKNDGGDPEHAIRRAQQLLDDITNKYEQGLVGPFEKHVNSWVFEDLARMWARSRKPDAGDQVVALIRRMEELHTVVPGLPAYRQLGLESGCPARQLLTSQGHHS